MQSAVRRLLALSTLLSTLLGVPGWSHPACEMMADAMATEAGAHQATQGAHSASAAETDAGEEHSPCHHTDVAGDGVAGTPDAMCPIMAHCGSAVPSPLAALGSPHALAEVPHDGRETGPLDPARQPELQPPKA